MATGQRISTKINILRKTSFFTFQTAKILKTGLTGVEMGIKAIKTGKPTQATTTTESPIRDKV